MSRDKRKGTIQMAESKPEGREFLVGGRKIYVRERYPLATHGGVVRQLLDVDDANIATAIPLLQACILSWEFEGDPADEASYSDIDAPVVYAMFKSVEAVINDVAYKLPKN